MHNPSIQEFVRMVLTTEYPIPAELVNVTWPCTPEGDGKFILRLADVVRNPYLGWRIRDRAYNVLVTRVQELVGKGELGTIPPELAAWCVLVVAGGVKRPHAPVGRDASDNQSRDAKFAALKTYLRQNGYKSEDAINLIATEAGIAEETVASAIKKRRTLAKRTHYEMLNSVTNILGEQFG